MERLNCEVKKGSELDVGKNGRSAGRTDGLSYRVDPKGDPSTSHDLPWVVLSKSQ